MGPQPRNRLTMFPSLAAQRIKATLEKFTDHHLQKLEQQLYGRRTSPVVDRV
jgi:hypothetical protein